MSKYTPWFPGTVKPVHVGVYQRAVYRKGSPLHKWVYAKWDGWHWHSARWTEALAAKAGFSGMNVGPNSPKWRGLKERAK
jgi:hypothetical protein